MNLSVRSGENIYNVALKTYGIGNVYKLIQENNLDSISSIADLQILSFDETFKPALPPDINSKTQEIISNINYYTGHEGQSLYDICLMVYGSLNLYYKLLQDSKIDSTNEASLFGKVFTYDINFQEDSALTNHIQKSNLVFATKVGDGQYVDPGYVDSGYVL